MDVKAGTADPAEERFRIVVEESPIAMVMVNEAGTITLVNSKTEALFGYPRHELLGQSVEMLVPQRVHWAHPALRKDYLKDPKPRVVGEGRRLSGRRKDGTEVPVEIGLNLIATEEGKFVLATIIDVTEGRLDEARFHAMLEGAPTAMVMVSESGIITLINSQIEKLFGYRRKELLGQSLEVLVPVRFRDHLPALRSAFFEDPDDRTTSAGVDLYGLHRDGTEIPVEIGLNPITTRKGRFVMISVVNLSDRKRAEDLFQAMVEGAPNVMIMINEAGIITLVNTQTEKLFGYRREELQGRPAETLLPVRFRGHHAGLGANFQHDLNVHTIGIGQDMYGLRRDGSEMPVEISINPVITKEGHFVMASIIDISERKEGELRVQTYAEELRHMSQRLVEAQEMERRGIARELHDEVGQSLTAAGINLSDLQLQVGDGPLAVQLAEVSAIVARLLQQIRQLSLDLHPTVLDDLGIAPGFRWLVRERGARSGLDVTLHVAEDLPRFSSMVENTLFRVFQESLSNVLRHAQAKKLNVELRFEADNLILTIRDDGRGFDPAVAHRRALEGGSLGVLGMEERVRLAGGSIAIKSAVGEGTEIRVSLPAVAR
jgi:PAS domain S-box-containing protein